MAQINIVNHQDIKKYKRFDAEYFKKDDLRIQSLINKYGAKTISELECELDCSAFYPSITEYYDFEGNGVPFLRVNEIQNGIVDITNKTAFLPFEIVDEYSSNIKIAYPGDLIIAKGGNSLAKVGLLTDTFNFYAVCRDLIIIRTKNIINIDKYYLWLFLHSKIGQRIMLRTASQTGQPHLTINEIKNITVPIQTNMQNTYEIIFHQSLNLENKSKQLYQEAEQLFLEEIGLINYNIKHSLSFETTSLRIKESNRFDAEYFQPKYYELIEKIKNYENGFDVVKNVINFNNSNYIPNANKRYKYIALSDVSSKGFIETYDEQLGKELPSRARRKVKFNDVIISSIEGSLSSCALVEKEFDGYLCSTGFYIMNSIVFTSEVLLVIFKSEIMQNLLKRGSNGTILSAITKSEIEQLKIPLIRNEVQLKITEKIQESHKLRNDSKKLLDLAKKSVEIAINDSPEKAIKLLHSLYTAF